jgi:hypothetical protein
MKEKYHNVGTVPQSYREIVEGGQTDTTNTLDIYVFNYIHTWPKYFKPQYI